MNAISETLNFLKVTCKLTTKVLRDKIYTSKSLSKPYISFN